MSAILNRDQVNGILDTLSQIEDGQKIKYSLESNEVALDTRPTELFGFRRITVSGISKAAGFIGLDHWQRDPKEFQTLASRIKVFCSKMQDLNEIEDLFSRVQRAIKGLETLERSYSQDEAKANSVHEALEVFDGIYTDLEFSEAAFRPFEEGSVDPKQDAEDIKEEGGLDTVSPFAWPGEDRSFASVISGDFL